MTWQLGKGQGRLAQNCQSAGLAAEAGAAAAAAWFFKAWNFYEFHVLPENMLIKMLSPFFSSFFWLTPAHLEDIKS